MKFIAYSLSIGAFSALTSVALGAFAAHGLKSSLSDYQLAIFNLAAEYQMIHSLALIACGLVAKFHSTRFLQAAVWLFIAGSILFCGSLYLLALGAKGFGLITPLGGLCFIVAWLCLAIHAWPKSKNSDKH